MPLFEPLRTRAARETRTLRAPPVRQRSRDPDLVASIHTAPTSDKTCVPRTRRAGPASTVCNQRILPASTAPGNPAENTLLPATVAGIKRLEISPREVALDGGFMPGPTNEALAELAPDRVFISGRQEPGSRRTNRRLQRYRTGEEGRISHLKRRYGLGRSRLPAGPRGPLDLD